MKFSVCPTMIPPEQLLSVARAADESGWNGFALPDSVFYVEKVTVPYPYSEDGERHWAPEAPFVDPLAAFPAMAAVTQRLFFFSNVLKAPLHQPLLLAKNVGSMASLFPGRIGLGLGTSWIPQEFEWVSEDMRNRGKRLNEMIEIMRLCMQGGWAEFHGEFYDFDRLMMSPWPSEPVPRYVGGHAPAALHRAAELGDGWLSASSDPEYLEGVIPQMEADRADSAMAGVPFEVIAMAQTPPPLDLVLRLEEIGVDHIVIIPTTYGMDASVEARCDAVKRYAANVIQAYQG
jgi:probable F420-dependent oxidoreductase